VPVSSGRTEHDSNQLVTSVGPAGTVTYTCYLYASNNPIEYVDPSGLTTISVALWGKWTGCGGFDSKIRFELVPSAPCDGYLCQQIYRYYRTVGCSSCEGCPTYPEQPLQEKVKYWECFPYLIKAGKAVSKKTEQIGYTDTGRIDNHSRRCGYDVLSKRVVFVCAKDILISGDDFRKWPSGNEAGIPAGTLPVKKFVPKFWGKAAASTCYAQGGDFDCCTNQPASYPPAIW